MTDEPRLRAGALYLNVFVVAICGLVYELLAGTLGSYLLGDSVTQFSLVIGLYLSAMGGGAWLSRHLGGNLARRFVELELAVALVGGVSAPCLFLAFGTVVHFQVVLLAFVAAIGVLVGLELPLLMRLLEKQVAFKDLVSRVLTFDYIGALAAAILFPLVLVPKLGLVRSSLAMGIANAGVALWGTWLLGEQLGRARHGARIRAIIVIALLGVGFGLGDRFTSWAEDEMYADPVVFTQTTPYQRIVVTRGRAGFQLFLNGNLQFASADEYRYHEALVHPAMAAADAPPRRALVLGGGDGLALREILKYPQVETATLVDLDPAMTHLATRFPALGELNHHSFEDPRVTVVNDDALVWLGEHAAKFDLIIVDFPDPNNFTLGKLYTKLFYRRVLAHLAPGGAVAVQATSPLFARKSYWCIIETLRAAGFSVLPYQVTVPSFGVWGYALARQAPGSAGHWPPAHVTPDHLKYLNDQSLAALFAFAEDTTPVPVEINQLDNQALVRYYEREWRRWE
ncbi:MAG TPA: polyamine aminopropyltransferase [Kofleriaceae bacterium]|jgi:spermidine synthase